jgi:hypothetical protein
LNFTEFAAASLQLLNHHISISATEYTTVVKVMDKHQKDCVSHTVVMSELLSNFWLYLKEQDPGLYLTKFTGIDGVQVLGEKMDDTTTFRFYWADFCDCSAFEFGRRVLHNLSRTLPVFWDGDSISV